MEFALGAKVKLLEHGISKGMIIGIEEYENWKIEDSEIKRDGYSANYDYKIVYIEDGEIIEEWYSEGYIEQL